MSSDNTNYNSESENINSFMSIDEVAKDAVESFLDFDVDRLFLKKHHILSRKDVENMKNFKYNGHDYSYIHNYVSIPICQFICRFIPRFISPNVITITGLMFNIVAYFILSYYSFRFDGDIPSWALYYASFAMIAYYIFDILDGMVARKYGTGSPMGMLVDHGCDCINTTLIAVNICSTLHLSSKGINIFLLYFYWVFYFSSFVNHTSLQYLTGFLRLGRINGPNEGIFLVSGFYFLQAYFGQVDRKQGLFVYFLTGFFSLYECIYKTVQYLIEIKRRNLNFSASMAPLIYFYLIVLCNGIWLYLEPKLFEENPRILFSFNACMAADILTELMISHICARSYRGHVYKLLPLLFIGILNALTKYITPAHTPLFDSYTVIYIVAIFSLYNIARRTFSVVKQMSQELDVPILAAKKEKKQD